MRFYVIMLRDAWVANAKIESAGLTNKTLHLFDTF